MGARNPQVPASSQLMVPGPIATSADLPGVVIRARTAAWPAELVDLYRTHYLPMVRLAYLLCGSREVAEELVQDSFLKVRRNWKRARQPAAYLRTAVTNACRSHHRRRALEIRRRPSAPVPAQLGADEMWDALLSLPFRQRAAIVLRFYHDMSELDVASVLGCSPGTVGSAVHRGLARLRKEIGE